MTTSYFNIMMNHLEHMQFDVAAAAETSLQGMEEDARGRSDAGDCTKLLFVTAGEGRLLTADGEEALKPGDCAMILPGTEHAIEPQNGGTLVFKWCHIRAKYRERDVYKKLGLPLVVNLCSEEAGRLIDTMIRCLPQEGIAARLRVKGAVLELLSLYIERLPEREKRGVEAAPSQEMAKIETVLQYIDDHLMDNVTIEELARLVYLHPNYFIVFFKSMLGCSPIQYVNNRRMEVARQLLLDPKHSVSDVANRIGMKIYYFSRMFKTQTGLTPSRYRKLAAERKGKVSGSDAEALLAAAGKAD
ncbi:AraC family transcriptional regulator [Cohnella lubricantis]|uniref:Helix-turn-helix transcriptional regulator n=1 Tax=Cohnella lubricantis TaxID=2163172 RepID=A0A841TCF2_9BACL|nr:AraC family transcriptional regulator [Cohnella lubricantis]MBB6678984.1 helix-turn-helix transcriptional regulator [Cohnella lubricantis]MBP2118795.1 AraC-like DNA-binding protein [Cohnella lubricantis]